MEAAKEYCDIEIYPRGEQIEQIEKCLILSQNVVREIKKITLPTDTMTVISQNNRIVLKRFQNRGHQHFSRIALNTVVGTLSQFGKICILNSKACHKKSAGFSQEFIEKAGVCCLYEKKAGEALLLNNMLLLPSLGTIPIAQPWKHCFNKVTLLFIYRRGVTYRARVYSSWPFEEPESSNDPWLGISLGKHKLLFLSDGRSFSYYHLMKERKKHAAKLKHFDATAYYADVFHKIYNTDLNGFVLLRSQLILKIPMTISGHEKCAFLLLLLERAKNVGLKVRIVSGPFSATENDFEKAQSIRHSRNTQELNELGPLIADLRQKLASTISLNEETKNFG